MNPFSKLYGWLLGAVAVAATVVGIYLRGRSAGKKVEQAKATKQDLADERAKSETLREASDVQIEVSRLPADDVHQRLAKEWQRD